MKTLLVGEHNPLSTQPRHALYPYPPNCSGERLQRLILGVSRRDYLSRFDRVDLCVERWNIREARRRAAQVLEEPARPAIVLLGSKVCEAFGVPFDPFTIREIAATPERAQRLVILPHPSGRCRTWHEAGAYLRARDVLERGGVFALPTNKTE